jgi:protein-S-isoprenylcysteine O-methyltransferase Ste14
MISSSLIFWAIVAICAGLAGVCYLLARQSDLTLGWLYLRLFAICMAVHIVFVLFFNPIVLVRRMVFHPGTKPWDFVFFVWFIAALLAIIFVAQHDLDTRTEIYGPSGSTWLIGAFVLLFGWAMVTWSMIVNPFFEKTVRIQTDNEHRVIDTGPYALVRHPGYVGFSAMILATPLLLASSWTWLPVLLAVLCLAIRTIPEDHMLRTELPGYAEYASRVRFRWVPGIW